MNNMTPTASGGAFQNADALQSFQPEMDLRRRIRWAWRVAWRGKYLMLACLLALLAPVLLILQQLTPRYTAQVKVVIEAPETADILSDRNLTVPRQRLTDAVIQTEADLIASSVLARRVIDKLRLEQDPEFNSKLRERKFINVLLGSLNPISWIPASWRSAPGDTETLGPLARENIEKARIVRAFSARLKVTPQRRSFVITLTFTSENREKAALIANTIAELYLLDRLEASFDEARRVSGWLGERLETLQRDVVAAETAVEEFRSKHGLRRKNERQATISDQQLSELNSRLVLARTELSQKQARLEQVRTLIRSRGTLDTSSDVLQSPLIQRLREQEAIRSREMSEAMKTYGARHPRIVGLRADLDDLRGKIGQEIERIAASIANDVEVAVTGVRSLERQLDSLRTQTNEAGEAEVQLRDLERQAEASRALYEAALTRFKREAEQEHMQRANARIVSPADVPVVSSYPPSQPVLSMTVLLALLIGLGLAFLLDHLDNALRSADDVEELTGLPTLAMVPYQRTRGQERAAEEVLRRPRSALADAVRSIRTALDIRAKEEDIRSRVVLITSSVPKEGKTFVSLCLGLLLGKVDEKVLLIDGDIHRPRLHAALGAEGERGLAQVLAGQADLDEVIQPSVLGNVDFLPAGRVTDPADIVQGLPIEQLLTKLRTRYNRIVIDSPPVLAVADTLILARQADHVIYLVKWGSTPRDAVRNGVKLLRGAGANLFGIALSQVNQRKHARYGYGDYGQYYGRYQDYYGE